MFRVAPFDPASTVPDASLVHVTQRGVAHSGQEASLSGTADLSWVHPVTFDLLRAYRDQLQELPTLRGFLDPEQRHASNIWAISGRHTRTGQSFLANDPHLLLGAPTVLYPLHLHAGPIDVIGHGLAGVPGIPVGHNQRVSWGATASIVDVTDTYQEQVVADATSPSGLSTVYKGEREPIVAVPEVFRQNTLDGVPDNLTTGHPAARFLQRR